VKNTAPLFARQASACQTILEGWLADCEHFEDDELAEVGQAPCTSMCVSGSRFYGFPEWTRPTTKRASGLRPSVVVRKTMAVTRRWLGRLKHACLMSLIVSCEQQEPAFPWTWR